jgi:manganese-dependent inorganic pyrophosphatase
MIDISALDSRIDELFADMKLMKEESNLHTIAILLTDIMKEGSQILVLSDDASKVESAFNVKLENNQAWLDGVLSRKKQIIPFLQPQF